MPRIFDNIEQDQILLPALKETIQRTTRGDFCVGYFNLRGWKSIADDVERWSATENSCRVLVGMQDRPEDELRKYLRVSETESIIDQID